MRLERGRPGGSDGGGGLGGLSSVSSCQIVRSSPWFRSCRLRRGYLLPLVGQHLLKPS